MESWFRSFFLSSGASLLLITGLAVTAAETNEQVIQPEVERRAIKPTAIDTEDFETGIFAGLMNVEDFGTHLVYGARLGYHVSEYVFAEATYGQTETGQSSFERLSGNIQLLDNNDHSLQYMNIAFGLNLLPGESFIGSRRAMTSAFYLMGGLGGTRFGGNDIFTWNFGVGFQMLVNDWLAIRVDTRDHVFDLDLLGTHQTNHNLEMTSGISVFF